NTGNDVWDANCTCAGQTIDCLGVAGGTALPGTACNDNNAGTINDAWDANCNCAGTPVTLDCLGVPNGTALPGTACDDGNANTGNDVWDANCNCAGTPVTLDCLGVPNGTALPGTACDDGDACTTADVWDANCNCAGTPLVPDASFAYAQSAYCETAGMVTPWAADTSGIFQSTGGLVIDATTGTVDLGLSTPGVYQVTHVIGGACPALSTEQITIDSMPDPSWTVPQGLCSLQGPVDLDVLIQGQPGGQWTGAGVTASSFDPSIGPGAYQLTYTVMNGSCTATLEQVIAVQPGPHAEAGPDTAVCGTSAVLQAVVLQVGGTWSGPAGCTFSDPNAAGAEVSVPAPGLYTFVWTVGQAPCQAIDSVVVNFHPPGTALNVSAGPDQELAAFTSTTLQGQADAGATLQWTRIAGAGHIATPEQPVTDVIGLAIGDNLFVLQASLGSCATGSDTVRVTVLDIFIPQGISPNGDGVNDRFEITGIQAFPDNELKVFDRWGRPVFTQRGYDNSWEGRGTDGSPLIDDTYFYVLNLDGERTYNGYLIIKR
ncbi:MAG: gliding motility-associated C-terminal domain-containing protein, partial [Flavobacteriales bacterium]|nr:gliding motility-associated C-terminal domain-containing protein [Flavobacteriales bacterium]